LVAASGEKVHRPRDFFRAIFPVAPKACGSKTLRGINAALTSHP